MFNNTNGMSAKFLSRMFKRIDGLVWDLQTGQTGLKDENGIYTLTQEVIEATPGNPASVGVRAVKATEASVEFGISVNPFDSFGMAIPAFATQVPFADIKPGDLIVGDKEILGWVKEKTASALKLLDKNGMGKNYTPPKVQILANGGGAMVVQSLGGLCGGNSGVGGLQSSLMPFLMMQGDDSEGLESILPMMLFSQMQTSNSAVATSGATAAGAGAAASNPMAAMMPMMLMQAMGKNKKSGKGKSIDPMMLMMMSGGFGGGNQQGGMAAMLPMLMMMGGLDDDNVTIPTISASGGFAPALQKMGVPALRPIDRNGN
jgi:hypothetical protein